MTEIPETADGQAAARPWISSFLRRWWVIPLCIYLLTRVVGGILIAGIAHDAVAIPSRSYLTRSLPAHPGYLPALTEWDGQWYAEIAEHGYPVVLPRQADGTVEQNAWAFYPLYPFVVRGVMEATRFSFPLAATAVSTLAGAGAVLLLYRLVAPSAGRLNALLAVTALSAYPAAPLLQTAYSEAMALLLLLLSLTLLRSRRYGWLILAVVALSFTRPIVLPFALVIAWHWWIRWRGRAEEPFPIRARWVVGGVAAGTLASFALWPLIAGIVTGVPDAYLLTQDRWHGGALAHRGSWPSWLFLALRPSALTLVVVFAAVALSVFLFRPASRVWGPELRAWGVAYGAFLLIATQAETSIVRLAMLLVIWWPFALKPFQVHSRTLATSLVGGVLVVGFITQGLWLHSFYFRTATGTHLPIRVSCCAP